MKIPGEFGIVGELEIKMAFVVRRYVSSDCPIKLSNNIMYNTMYNEICNNVIFYGHDVH